MKLGAAELAKAHQLMNQGRIDEAERAYRRLTRQIPRLPDAPFYLGTLLARRGRFDEAIEALQRAVKLAPNAPAMTVNLAAALRGAGRTDEAVSLLKAVLAQHPEMFEAWAILGIAQREAGELAAAIASYQKAITLRPDQAQVRWNLASALQECGRWDASAVCCREALALDPELTMAKLGLGWYHLATGNWAEGWAGYEYRWATIARPDSNLPQWRGESVPPETRLLVFDEQGIGDAIQFSRYLALAASQFAEVGFVCPRPLASLLRRHLPDNVELLAAAPTDDSPWQWHCPLMSLPLAFDTRPDRVPAAGLWHPENLDAAAAWLDNAIGPDGRSLPRVGVVRCGNPAMKYARWRDIGPEEIGALCATPGIAWVNLQKDADLLAAAPPPTTTLVDPMPSCKDFDETANIISALDLVIAVDTAVAHLAAQLGKPVWLLSWGEWRWLPPRTDTPWYPSMHIYTRDVDGGWPPCLLRVRRDLEHWRDRRAANRPQ